MSLKIGEEIIVKVRFDELPKPFREDFLLEMIDGKIKRKEVSPILKEIFLDPEKPVFTKN